MCARTIKVECVRAQFLEKKTMHSSSGPAFDSANFKQANKKDAKFAPTNSTTRAGKSLALAPKNTGYGTYDIYSQGSVQVASAQIKYRMRHVLQEWWAQQRSVTTLCHHAPSFSHILSCQQGILAGHEHGSWRRRCGCAALAAGRAADAGKRARRRGHAAGQAREEVEERLN